MLDPVTQWWTVENPNSVDSYFFGHGSDFVGALGDYTKLGGVVAMPPRAANGVFWSRWYNMNDADVNALVDDYENRGIPLDCYILDMDWHTKARCFSFGGVAFCVFLLTAEGYDRRAGADIRLTRICSLFLRP